MRFLQFLFFFSFFVSNVFAAGVLTVAPFPIADFIAVAGAVLVASALMWAVKKGLALLESHNLDNSGLVIHDEEYNEFVEYLDEDDLKLSDDELYELRSRRRSMYEDYKSGNL